MRRGSTHRAPLTRGRPAGGARLRPAAVQGFAPQVAQPRGPATVRRRRLHLSSQPGSRSLLAPGGAEGAEKGKKDSKRLRFLVEAPQTLQRLPPPPRPSSGPRARPRVAHIALLPRPRAPGFRSHAFAGRPAPKGGRPGGPRLGPRRRLYARHLPRPGLRKRGRRGARRPDSTLSAPPADRSFLRRQESETKGPVRRSTSA